MIECEYFDRCGKIRGACEPDGDIRLYWGYEHTCRACGERKMAAPPKLDEKTKVKIQADFNTQVERLRREKNNEIT